MIILRRISSMESVSYTLKLGLTKVGRDISSNIHLNNSFVSRHHALIDVEENGTASVTDLGSSNGTYINSAVLNPKDFFTIEDGDILSFGVDTFTDDRTGCVFKVVIIEDGSNDDQQSNLQNGTQEPEKPSEKKDIVKECSVVLERLRLSNIDGHENNGSNVNGLENDDEKNNRMDEDPLLEDEPAIRKRRLSQDSIENLCSKKIRSKDDDKMDYTMDDIVICDDNEEDSEQFPCSQIFDDVQDKIVSDSDNDGDSEREDVIEIDDDSDEFGENERQWFNRLSQTFGSPGVMVKEEPIVLISDDDDNDDDCGDGVKEPQDGCCDAEKESASKAADEVSAVKCVLDSEQRITDGDIYIDLKNVPLPEEIIDNEIVSSDCEKIQVLKESSDNEIARSSGNFQMSKESIDEEKDSNGENVENVLDDFKPKTKAASKKIKLVEAMPISRRTRSKKRKIRSKPTKVNVSPLKPTLTNSQKTLRKEKLKTIATVDNNSTAAAAANDNEINPTHSRSTSCAKVTPKSRSDILVDSLINNKPSTSSNKGFRIPKVKKSNRDKCPTDELNHDTSPTENVSDEIAIAGPSSAVPKRKNVSFNDNIQCMEIEPIAGTRKYQFSKLDHKTIRRADQALPMQINTYKMSWKLDEIFSYILRWSVTWLEEEKKFSAQGVLRKPPPVGFEIPIKRLPFEFQNYFEYYKCVLPLALLEMWAKTSNDYFNKANQMYLVKVDSYRKENLEISMLPNSTACRKQLVINCHTFIHDRNMREGYLRTGDFGIAELRFSINGQNKHVYINVFCYVQNVSARRLGSAPYIGDTDLLQKLGLEYDSNLHCLDLVLLIKWRSEEEALVTNGIVRLKIISYIRPTLKHFVSLLNLQASPLSAAILSPSTFDFSVEELQIRKPHGKLNHAQERAVAQATKLCLSAKPNIGLIHGPPGTGKSHVIISLIQHIISECTRLFKTRPRILLCAPTNAAIDQLAIKLRDIRSKLPEKKRFKLIRTGQVDRKSEVYCLTPESLAETQLKKAANKDSEEHELELRILQAQRTGYASAKSDSKIDKNRTDFLQKKIDAIDASLKTLLINGDQPRALRYQLRETEISVIKHAEIIATTLSSCTNDQFVNALTDNGRENPSITCCIIDEAAQCNETEILLPLVLDVKKMILVGDPLQLTATTFSEVSRQMGYGNSLFSRINEVWKNNKNCASASPIHFLDTQYRMHSSIASWPSRFVYQGRLKNNDLLQKDSELNAYMLINHSFPQSRERETNRMEAELVVSMAFSILKKSSSEALRIGVITPYSNQRKLIQTLIANRSNIECDFGNRLEVNSIDGFQGQERDVIIVSLVRSEGIGFMSDVQRINVMLTRAERCLLVCANFKAFLTNNIWKELYEDGCRRRKIFAINELDEEQLNELMETIYAKQKRTVSKVRSRHQ